MTSPDGEERFDDLSPNPLIHCGESENFSRKRLLQGRHCVREDSSGTTEKQNDLNIIGTSEGKIHHEHRKASENFLENRLFQAPLCVRRDFIDAPEKQNDPNKVDTPPKQNHHAGGKASEKFLDKRLLQTAHYVRISCYDTSQRRKDSNEINEQAEQVHQEARSASETCSSKLWVPGPRCIKEDRFEVSEEQMDSDEINTHAEQVHRTARRASETCLGKWLFNEPNCTREKRFDASKEQKNSNEIGAPAEHIYYASRKYSDTSLGERLLQAPHYIREDCFDTCLEQKKPNEINTLEGQVHHTARRASKTCLGKQLFQVTPWIIEDFSNFSEELQDLNDINVPEKHAHIADKKAPEFCSDKGLFLTSHYVRESFPEISDRRNYEVNELVEQVSHEGKRSPNTCLRKRSLEQPFYAGEDFPNTTEEQLVSSEIDASAELNYYAARRSLETCSGLQPLHFETAYFSKNSDRQKHSNGVDAAEEQVLLADRSTPEDRLDKMLFSSTHSAKGDFLDTREEHLFESSNDFSVSEEQVSRASGRTLETCLDKSLFQAPLCVREDSSDLSEDENMPNEMDAATQQDCLEARRDQITCLRNRSFRAQHYFSDELFGISKEPNGANKMNADAEQINQAAGSVEKTSANNEEGTKESWDGAWKACHFRNLPQWLQDNDFLLSGHRPPLNSFWACFSSVFQIHTETVNIWTHLAGCVLFVGITVHFLSSRDLTWNDKLVFGAFLASVILCLGTSTVFHAVSCHSERVCKLFGKLDYCGIVALITGSFVPWLHYGFYCEIYLRVLYCTLVVTLGSASTAMSLSDRFGEPHFRRARAALFAGFGLSGVVPAAHYLVFKGWVRSVGWLVLMAVLYLLGATIYASRIPERLFPGRCDIFFQSHQIFHVLVVAAALVHYHGTMELASIALLLEDCAPAIR